MIPEIAESASSVSQLSDHSGVNPGSASLHSRVRSTGSIAKVGAESSVTENSAAVTSELPQSSVAVNVTVNGSAQGDGNVHVEGSPGITSVTHSIPFIKHDAFTLYQSSKLHEGLGVDKWYRMCH